MNDVAVFEYSYVIRTDFNGQRSWAFRGTDVFLVTCWKCSIRCCEPLFSSVQADSLYFAKLTWLWSVLFSFFFLTNKANQSQTCCATYHLSFSVQVQPIRSTVGKSNSCWSRLSEERKSPFDQEKPSVARLSLEYTLRFWWRWCNSNSRLANKQLPLAGCLA